MKSKRGVLVIFVILAILLAWWLWPLPKAGEAPVPGTGAANQGTNRPNIGQQEAPLNESPGMLEEIVRDLTGARERQRKQAEERSLNEWRTPIEFYGKVVDENGQPVEGVAVKFSCNDTSVEGTSYYQTVSDGQGLFSITGIKGKLLTVAVSKTSYYSSKRDTDSFYYAGQNQNFVPNRNGPVLFHLRKRGQAEPLVTMDYPGFARIAQLPRNGTSVAFDLIIGTTNTTSGGHVQFEFTGDPISRETTRFDWQLRIIGSGGLLETNEEFPLLAPENGYSAEVEINHPVTLEDAWQTTIERKYFIRLADGRYGRIEFRLLARNGVFTMQSYLNPSGSRNLEYSEAVQSEMTTR